MDFTFNAEASLYSPSLTPAPPLTPPPALTSSPLDVTSAYWNSNSWVSEQIQDTAESVDPEIFGGALFFQEFSETNNEITLSINNNSNGQEGGVFEGIEDRIHMNQVVGIPAQSDLETELISTMEEAKYELKTPATSSTVVGAECRRAEGRIVKPRAGQKRVPPEKKDAVYWEKRARNNEAARRCRAATRGKGHKKNFEKILKTVIRNNKQMFQTIVSNEVVLQNLRETAEKNGYDLSDSESVSET